MQGDLMDRARATPFVLAVCLSVFAITALPISDRATAGKVAKKRDQARSYVLERTHRGYRRSRRQRIHLPIGPAYVYYDYPYYYSRGHYPTHIGGYVYYIPGSAVRCSNRKCPTSRRGPRSAR